MGGRGTLNHPMVSHPMVKAGALLLIGAVSTVIVLQYGTVLAGATTKLFGIDNTFTLRYFVAAVTDSRDALVDTIGLALAASPVTAIVGVLAAYYIARTELLGRNVLDFVANLPLAIPGTVVGLAFALAFNHRPLLLTGNCAHHRHGVRHALAALCDSLGRGQHEPAAIAPSTRRRRTWGATSGQTTGAGVTSSPRPARRASMIFTFLAQCYDAECGHFRRVHRTGLS